MSKTIINKPTLGTRPTVTNSVENYRRYEAFREAFKKEQLYRFFAEPLVVEHKQGKPTLITWRSEWENIVSQQKLIDLPEMEREQSKGRIQNLVKRLFEQIEENKREDSKYQDFEQILNDSLEIPTEESVYVLKIQKENGAVEEHYILTEWGFLEDKLNPASGIIRAWKPTNYIHVQLCAFWDDKSIAAGQHICLEYENRAETQTTNEKGFLEIQWIPRNASIHCFQLNDKAEKINIQNVNVVYTDANPQTEYEIILQKPKRFANIEVTVKNGEGVVLPQQKVYFEWSANPASELTSDENGKILLPSLQEGTNITAYRLLASEKDNLQTFVCNPDNPFQTVIISDKPSSKSAKFRFLNLKKEGEQEVKVSFAYQHEKFERLTDEKGEIFLDNLPLNLPIKIDAKKQRLYYKGHITHLAESDWHIIQLKKRNYLWLWLLLLLALLGLLFIPINKEIDFQVVTKISKEPMDSVSVMLKYPNRQNKKDSLVAYTNKKGTANFHLERILLYQYLWDKVKGYDIPLKAYPRFSAINCYIHDTIQNKYSLLKSDAKKRIFYVDARFDTLTFKVIADDGTNDALPDAEVVLKDERGNVQKAISDVSGEVHFRVSSCSEVSAKASLKGYIPDSISKKRVLDLREDSLSKRTLKLKPIKNRVSFYIKNLANKNGIAGAKVELWAGGKLLQTTTSNSKGSAGIVDGEATFDLARLEDIEIKAFHGAFYDSTLTGKASFFMTAPPEARTIYLRPKALSAAFVVLDADTRAPIEGAKVVLTHNGKTETLFSGASGEVNFPPLDGAETVSILAQKMGYHDNADFTSQKWASLLKGKKEILMRKLPPPPPEPVPEPPKPAPKPEPAPEPPPPPPPPPPPVKYCIMIWDYNNAQDDDVEVFLDGMRVGEVHNEEGDYEIFHNINFTSGSHEIRIKVTKMRKKDVDLGSKLLIFKHGIPIAEIESGDAKPLFSQTFSGMESRFTVNIP